MKIKNTQNDYRLSLGRRITAAIMSFVMLAQVCLPGVAAAAVLVTDDQIASEVMSDYQFQPSSSRDYLYEQAAYFNQTAPIQNKTIADFHKDLVKAKLGLPAPTYIPLAGDITVILPVHVLGKVIGDAYVQNRYIRSQITDLLGRHMIDTAAYATELAQINTLYANAFTFARTNAAGYVFGKKIAQDVVISQDMIWPELRTINGQKVLVPIVYLTDNTLNTRGVKDHTIEFAGTSAQFANIILDKTTLLARRNAFIQTMGDIVNAGGTISGQQNLTLAVGGTLKNISGNISADKNLSIIAGQIYNKTQVHPFTDKNGSGTRLGEVAGFDSTNGNINLQSYSDIIFEGANATANNGSISFNAANNIVIAGVSTQYQGIYKEGDWKVNKSTLEIFKSRLNAQETISLIAGGAISISASDLISTEGGIELLAQQGIHILDELNQESIQKVDRKGKTKGQSSEFRSEAVRAILYAGKGVLLDTEFGDVTLKAAKITSNDGAQVSAQNGKVNLLMTKELEEFHLNTVRKGTWTIKTKIVDIVHETNIPNAIVGGIAVHALNGVEVEYTGKEDATIAQQIEEYRRMPGMEWMGQLYDQSWVNKNSDPNAPSVHGSSINWNAVEEIHKEIRKSKSTLSPAAMAIIAIAVCVAMGPAGANLIGAGGVGGATVTTTSLAGVTTVTTSISLTGAIAQAAMLTLATQAAQSLASGNNLRETINSFDSDENLKSLAISMATAGAMNYANVGNLELFEVAEGAEYGFASFTNQAYNAVVGATIDAGVSVTINGGNSEAYREAFRQSLTLEAVNTIGDAMTQKIGSLANGTAPKINEAMKYIALAGSGCLIGLASAAASQQPSNSPVCYSGAGGAVVGEYVGEMYSQQKQKEQEALIAKFLQDKGIANTTDFYHLTATEYGELVANRPKATREEISAMRAIGVDLSKLSAALVAFVAGGDVNVAASAGQRAAQYSAFYNFDAAMEAASAIQQFMKLEKVSLLLEKLEQANGDIQKMEVLIAELIQSGEFEFLRGLSVAESLNAIIKYLKVNGDSADLISRFNRILDSVPKGSLRLTSASIEDIRADLIFLAKSRLHAARDSLENPLDPRAVVQSELIYGMMLANGFDPNDDQFVAELNKLISYAPLESQSSLRMAIGITFGLNQFLVNTAQAVNSTGEFIAYNTVASVDAILWAITDDSTFKSGALAFQSGVDKFIYLIENLDSIPASVREHYRNELNAGKLQYNQGNQIIAGKIYANTLLEIFTAIYGAAKVAHAVSKIRSSSNDGSFDMEELADELEASRSNREVVDGEFHGVDDQILPDHVFVSKKKLESFIDENEIPLKEGWTAERLWNEVLAKPKGQRPAPETYLPADYIASHLNRYQGGASRIMLKDNLERWGPSQTDGTSFVSTKAEIDLALSAANGDPVLLARFLGMPDNYYVGKEIVRVDVPNPSQNGLRMPSGKEAGANPQWIPAGKLPGGISEAIVDLDPNMSGTQWHGTPISLDW